MTIRLSKKRALLLGGLAAIAISVIAVAYWTSSGTGTGSATTDAGNNAAFTFETTSATGNLAPGAGVKPITGTVRNSDATETYRLNTLTVTVSDPSAGDCDANDYVLSDAAGAPAWTIDGTGTVATLTGIDTQLAANGTYSLAGLDIAFNNKAAENQDDCKAKAVSLALTAAG